MTRFSPPDLELDSLPRRGHLADQVARQLARRIRDGVLAPGDQLPSGARLMEELQVSRSVVREAIARLESEGYVSARQGKGVFVTDWTRRQPFRLDDEQLHGGRALAALIELRCEVESGAAALAAVRRSEHELARLASCVRRMAEARNQEEASAADLDFHGVIADATHNAYYRDFSRYLDHQIRPAIALSHQQAAGRTPDQRLMLEEHRAIFEAIETGDADRARALMRQHLTGVIGRLGLPEVDHD